MVTIVSVRFRNVGKIYYFAPGELTVEAGDKVIVETARGVEMGTIVVGSKEVEEESIVSPLKEILRIATDEDIAHAEENRQKEKEAYNICKEKIAKHNLDMKLVGAEYTFDNKKLLFYFTSEGRVDFRDLVKDLAGVFRTRIELRQIGVRDEAKILGGLGRCGRELCCASYLSDFVPVSIKMAKEQGLSLNPMKISGNCGRLMCCLKNENETYKYLNSTLPNKGEIIITPTGREAKVEDLNVIRQQVVVLVDGDDDIKERQVYSVDEITIKNHHKKKIELTDEEKAELKGLEDDETSVVGQDEESAVDNNHDNRGGYKKRRGNRHKRHSHKDNYNNKQ